MRQSPARLQSVGVHHHVGDPDSPIGIPGGALGLRVKRHGPSPGRSHRDHRPEHVATEGRSPVRQGAGTTRSRRDAAPVACGSPPVPTARPAPRRRYGAAGHRKPASVERVALDDEPSRRAGRAPARPRLLVEPDGDAHATDVEAASASTGCEAACRTSSASTSSFRPCGVTGPSVPIAIGIPRRWASRTAGR